jgi:aspartokinase-like uncharacterized kinase
MPIDSVVKIGGGLLAHPAIWQRTLDTIARAARAGRRIVVVPGGGPFADTVRDLDARYGLSDETAHLMAILAMDQHALLIADRLTNGAVVETPESLPFAHDRGQIPVLTPYRWLRTADPLPHSWDVTSDSIAAWIAGEIGAKRLVLVKPPGAAGASADDLVDPWFDRARPDGLDVVIVPADELDERTHLG